MPTQNPANTDFEIHDLIKNRWSPVAYKQNDSLSKETVDSLLEAARWAPSSYNEQPWSYIVGFRGDETHSQLASTLAEGNSWAKEAPVLILSVAKNKFALNGKENRHAMYDTGAANTLMHIQATAMNLAFHQMGGFDLEKVRTYFNISDDFTPASMIAIGHQDLNNAPEDLASRDQAERKRKPHQEMYFAN